jgi:assimilatory nitrate reductase catalytic subunit
MNAPVQAPAAVRTACPYCGVGCGVLARPSGNGGTIVTGDPDHPANFGRLCSKGFALDETLGLDGRLLYPMLRQDGQQYLRVGWDAALATVADGFKRIVERDGPDAVAFYLSGQLLTEDYYVANKLMKGFIGSANVDTNSRLCMASTVAGHVRAFGGDVVPGNYEDLDLADLLVLVGSNTAWCHPVLFQRMVRNRRDRGAKLVVVDPRRTVTADEADLFLPIKPGTDSALFCGLLVHLADNGSLDRTYIDAHTSGFVEALTRARELAPDAAATARATALAEADVLRFFTLFGGKERAVTCFSQGVNQSAQGTDKVNAIINCHLATGRIGRAGMGPFSLTGQPNAMGGREVGGLANQLAAHMRFAPADVDRVRRFWNAPRMAAREGHKAVQMFEAIERGEIKALWVMATNPAMSLPRAGAVRNALRKLELFVVSDNVLRNDTIGASPHVLLPAAAWGEKDGTVTNSERCISRQRGFLTLPGEARPDWRIVTDVGRRMGYGEAFSYRCAADVFREHAALSAFENGGTRGFDIGALARISDQDYDALEPVYWPARAGQARPQNRLFADGGFFTADRKARFVAPAPPALAHATSAEFPLRLNTGRLRDQWHSMTRTGLSPRLGAHRPEPFVEVHPLDAEAHGLVHGGFARVTSAHGACTLQVVVCDGQQRGSIFVPIHWSDANASSSRVGDLVAPVTDPVSGQPEAKATPAAIAPVAFGYRGFALARTPRAWPLETWWAQVAVADASGCLIATNDGPMVWHDRAPHMFADAVLTEYIDRRKGLYRAAAFVDGRLDGALFIGPADAPPLWDDLRAMVGGPGIAASGPVVCACFGVGLAAIHDALTSRKAASVDGIGSALRAGTKCGSCLPELRTIVSRNEMAHETHAHRDAHTA